METRERLGDAQIPKGIIFIKVNTYKEIFLNWKKAIGFSALSAL